MSALPEAFLTVPLAHRGLHGAGAAENSMAAFDAAVEAGYGIECDLRLSSDGVAMVFHDATLDRMTDESGPVALHEAEALGAMELRGGGGGIPTLSGLLERVAGRVPILIELKDPAGDLTGGFGDLEAAAAADLAGYDGPVAVMSFAPPMVARMARLAPDVPRGLVTCDFAPAHWPGLPEATAAHLRAMGEVEAVGASFVSHDARDLGNPALTRLAGRGVPVLTWTIRSAEAEAAARAVAANVTFEGYRPAR